MEKRQLNTVLVRAFCVEGSSRLASSERRVGVGASPPKSQNREPDPYLTEHRQKKKESLKHLQPQHFKMLINFVFYTGKIGKQVG